MIQDIPLTRIDGTPDTLAQHRGKVLLIVNLASKCGLTPQYEGLERLFEAKRAQGLEVLGFPANNFMGQEPGSDDEIATFCASTYNVQFPMFSKISVAGGDKHPLYTALVAARPDAAGAASMRERLAEHKIETHSHPEVSWNFEKFVLSRRGEVVARFASDITVEDPRLIEVLDAELAKLA